MVVEQMGGEKKREKSLLDGRQGLRARRRGRDGEKGLGWALCRCESRLQWGAADLECAPGGRCRGEPPPLRPILPVPGAISSAGRSLRRVLQPSAAPRGPAVQGGGPERCHYRPPMTLHRRAAHCARARTTARPLRTPRPLPPEPASSTATPSPSPRRLPQPAPWAVPRTPPHGVTGALDAMPSPWCSVSPPGRSSTPSPRRCTAAMWAAAACHTQRPE
ncbi:hypothetical protein B0J12DRAFT_39029 [Macrophomina phaseolina]|uniref:Uncharacterized protein n=1 Tax=Macrophomina phaseolina TaxID=35725 RepID=A0ABQ8GWC3_9PEZI|nr:hypothetical protein B0J12DRAFT_39029 [Macrophomina phaseolina]